jgi:hypothetical protein
MALRRNYVVQGTSNVASPSKTTATLISATTVRPCIYDLILGSSATPADNALLWQIQRFTAAGTAGSSPTPTPLDAADPASQTTAGIALSAEPTYTANLYLLRVALNARATHRWICDPDGPLRLPATASNGAGMFVTHASFTGAVDMTWFLYE